MSEARISHYLVFSCWAQLNLSILTHTKVQCSSNLHIEVASHRSVGWHDVTLKAGDFCQVHVVCHAQIWLVTHQPISAVRINNFFSIISSYCIIATTFFSSTLSNFHLYPLKRTCLRDFNCCWQHIIILPTCLVLTFAASLFMASTWALKSFLLPPWSVSFVQSQLYYVNFCIVMTTCYCLPAAVVTIWLLDIFWIWHFSLLLQICVCLMIEMHVMLISCETVMPSCIYCSSILQVGI